MQTVNPERNNNSLCSKYDENNQGQFKVKYDDLRAMINPMMHTADYDDLLTFIDIYNDLITKSTQ